MNFISVQEILFVLICQEGLKLAAAIQTVEPLSITNFKECIASDEMNFLTALVKISFRKCVNECENRMDCQAVNYHRRTKICELMSTENGKPLKNSVQQGSCLLVIKSQTTASQTCSCPDGEVCNGLACETKNCQVVTPKKTVIVGNMNSIGSTILFKCEMGYINIGDKYATCLHDGTWSHQPQCVVDCGIPETVSDASSSFNATTENSVVVYSCLTGYAHTAGDLMHMCSSNASWIGILPKCSIECFELPVVPSSSYSAGNTHEGSNRMYTCEAGKYFYTGTISEATTCQSNGSWSNMYVICPTGGNFLNCPGCGILRDCEDVQNLGATQTGTYLIYPNGNGITVRCDLDTSSGGWTTIQRRISNSDFYKTWLDYKNGFGNVSDNFWLGNDIIATLTSLGNYKIRIDMWDQNNAYKYAEYSTFSITGESGGYMLTLGEYSGTAGDSLSIHNGMMFTTKDMDNDPSSTTNCASYYTGAWWFNACHDSNLNGVYGSTTSGHGIVWYTFTGLTSSLIKTEMKIKRF